jgi:molybdate transport system substrate-binding protein
MAGGTHSLRSLVRLAQRPGWMITATLLFATLSCHQKPSEKPSTSEREEIVVAAAVSLKDAFLSMAELYQRRTGRSVNYSFGASGELMKQIEAGAPVDVFASAGEREMNELQSKDLVESSSRVDFAQNSLVVVARQAATLRLNSIEDLAQKSVEKISLGNPKTVPAGMYAQQLLEHFHLWERLQPRLIFSENVRQALNYVERGEVSAGIVYSTDVAIAHGKVKVVARAPEGTYGPILYPIAPMRGSFHPEAARQFIQFVMSSEGQGVLEKFGFLTAK